MSFQIFSLNTWKNWDKSGKAEVVQKIRSLTKENCEVQNFKEAKDGDLNLALYEVVSAVVKGLLRKDFAKPILTEVMSWHSDVPSQLVEVLSLVELEITSIDRQTKQRDHLLGLIKILDLEKLYKERFDIETLGDAGIIKQKRIFLTKQVKVKTKMFYKQHKFNLLREESEGYAKLITELNQEITPTVTPSVIIEVIRSLIGSFNLDPNRVLDLILESFECRPEEYKFYTGLLRLFPHEAATISEILGFKLNTYVENNEEAKGIYVLIALLLHANILTIPDIYDWLTPEDSSMVADHRKELESAREAARRANVVSTKDQTSGKETDKETKDKEKDNADTDAKERQAAVLQKCSANQKMQLCIALLQIGNWDDFLEMCNRFPHFYLVSYPPVSEALCCLIHYIIQPMHKIYCTLPSRLVSTPYCNPMRVCVYGDPASCAADMERCVFPMLEVLGPYICHDVSLLYKVLRIARQILKGMSKRADGEMQNNFYYGFLSVLDECLLPSVSMFESNPCVAEEVWQTLKFYPYQHRYKLYSRWKNEAYALHPPLIRNRTQLLKKAKYIMMRFTKDTIKPVSRGIGKNTHNSPAPIFEYILMQVQLYDNFITPTVDSLKYLTSLSYDVLGYCIVELLCLSKERVSDGLAISPWLQSLSSFCSSLCKKYPVELGGILQFIANQLKAENSVDLLLLKDIVHKMGGIECLSDLMTDQLEAMLGGEHLRREAGQFQQEKNTKRSSVRLKEALVDNGVAIPLLMLIAQQRAAIVYKDSQTAHLKLVGKLYDQCQETLVQFGSYLVQALTIEELVSQLPTIDALLAQFHTSADVAFFLTRPIINHRLQIKFEELRRRYKAEKKASEEDCKRAFGEACINVFEPIVTAIKPQYSNKIWEDMDPSFFLTFWTLTMSDLEVATRAYDKEIKKLEDTPTAKSRKRDVERVQSLKKSLEDEKKRQLDNTERVKAWLTQCSATWFNSRTARSPKNDTVTTFLQLCVFPRCTFSTLDAVYCAKFVRMLHSLKTPNFSTLLCYDKMYCDITYTVTSCTEQEAHHYARFLLGTLETVMYWHENAEHFERECGRYPGFITRYRISTKEANDYVEYENYRHVVHKWHYKIAKALVMCLESGDYIQIRNAILVLQGILPKFPAIRNLSPVIAKRIDAVKIAEKNKRNDLFVLANSYSGRLRAKKPQLIPEEKFHVVRRPPATEPKGSAPATNDKGSGDHDKGKSVKKETIELNGDVESKEKHKRDSHISKTDDKKREDKKDDHDKDEKKKREKKKDEKETKKKKDFKKDHSGDIESDDDEATEEREDSVVSNGSSTSAKRDRHEANRGSKRRKSDHDSKTRKDDSKKEKKRGGREAARDEDSAASSPKDAKRERKERKRVASPSPDLHKTKSRKLRTTS